MTPALQWDASLVPTKVRFHLQNTSRSGGPSLTGHEQIVASVSARWTAQLTVPLRGPGVLAWRALTAGLRGRAGAVLVPACEGSRAPWPVDAYGRRQAAIEFRVASSAALGDTALTLTRVAGSALLPGMMFSIGERLYAVTAVGGGPDAFAVAIAPGLRAAAFAGQLAEFARPVCRMRLASDDEGAADIDLGRHATVSASFVETL
jgi:hypothetical protein